MYLILTHQDSQKEWKKHKKNPPIRKEWNLSRVKESCKKTESKNITQWISNHHQLELNLWVITQVIKGCQLIVIEINQVKLINKSAKKEVF